MGKDGFMRTKRFSTQMLLMGRSDLGLTPHLNSGSF